MGIGSILGMLIVCFASAALVAYWLVDLRARRRTRPPEPGTTLRLRASSGMYRSRLVSVDESGWRISAPISRNHYVPLRVDETLTVEAPVDGGVYLFKTVVTARDTDSHELVLQPPHNVAPTDRRQVERCLRDDPVRVEGQEGRLIDISSMGARLKAMRRFPPGDRVRLDLPEGFIVAWVLDSWPTGHGDDWRENLRVRFEAEHEKACV